MSHLFIAPLSRRATKVEILGFISILGGLHRDRIGKIDLRGNEAIVEVPDDWLARLVRDLDGQVLGERRVRVWTNAPSKPSTGQEDHFERLARLLKLESQAEAKQALARIHAFSGVEAERTGETLIDLAITDDDLGLGGRRLLQLSKRNGAPLPWTRLDVGSPVILTAETVKIREGQRGVVYERTEHHLRIALADSSLELQDHESWRLDVCDDEITMQRQLAALQRVRLAKSDRLSRLRDVLLGENSPEFKTERTDATDVLDTSLNEGQLDAVRFALTARDVALIHGPPGTGKTTTIVELIRRLVRQGARVLACAPSNMAVDNMFSRLIAAKENAVRLGHPARIMPHLREHSLDMLVEEHDDVRLARKLVKQAMSLFRQADRYTRAKPEPGARQQARQEARSLLADARRLERQAVEHILDTADVLCATTTGLDSDVIGQHRFDVAIIDEACQSVEPGCWIPLLRCDRVVLAGDHCQLPPTIVSREAAQQGLNISLFERLIDMHEASIARQLTIQYRMHQSIMEFSSKEFYGGALIADDSVRHHRLCDLPGVTTTSLTETPLEYIDTAGASFDEELEPDGESRLNRQEAALVGHKVRQLLQCFVNAADIGVITPYAAQVRLLREMLNSFRVEVDSVDGFQGREKEAILISLVRSNALGDIGFLSDIRRMNVAMTRARRKLIIIGDSATLAAHPFYQRLLAYVDKKEAYRSVWEEKE